MKITIIDNDEKTVVPLMEYLLDKGHEVSTAPTLEGAVVLVYTQKPDLLIVDPHYNEKGRIILECAYPSRTKTVLMCEDTRLKNILRTDFAIDKPVNFEQLDEIIAEIKPKVDARSYIEK